MPWLPILAWALASQAAAAVAPLDVSTLKLTASTVIELDLGRMKGELRQIAWSADASQLYVQTAEANPPNERLHHFVVASEGGPLTAVAAAPDWARDYWAFKSDRGAPGMPSLQIDVKQERVTTKIGTGSGRPGTLASGLGSDSNENAAMASEGQRDVVWRFILLDETISEFKDARPIPGLMFGWGPRGSGTIAYTDAAGRLMLLDAQKHKATAAGVKDAILPAWSIDGSRLAYATKTGRRKYQLVWCTITR